MVGSFILYQYMYNSNQKGSGSTWFTVLHIKNEISNDHISISFGETSPLHFTDLFWFIYILLSK